MEVQLNRSASFEAALTKLKQGPKELRREFSRSVKQSTAPLESKLKEAVKGLDSKGAGGGGRVTRGGHLASRSKSGSFKGNTGLRANIAKGVTRKITLSGSRTGVRVRVDGKYLPESQKSLIKATNKGLVRHPLFGNRSTWVSQTFTPKGWFDETVKIYGPRAMADLERAVRKVMEGLQ